MIKATEDSLRGIIEKHGFKVLESSVRMFGCSNGTFVNICRIDDNSKKKRFKVNTDKEWEDSEWVIVPWQGSFDNETRVIRNEAEFIEWHNQIKV